MLESFNIEGYFGNEEMKIGSLSLNNIKLYINLPAWIEERNVYNFNKRKIGILKPKKFNGLSYYLYDIIIEDTDCYGVIETRDFGKCLVMITLATALTNKPTYETGCF